MKTINWFNPLANKYKALNNYLITKHPFVWQTQIHLVVIYALVFGLITFFIGLLYPVTFYQLCEDQIDVAKTKYNVGACCISISLLYLIYWRKKIIQYKNPDFSWKSSIIEAGIYMFGILMLWCASNMFSLGLNTNIGYLTLKGTDTYADALKNTNYFTMGYLPHQDPGRLDSTGNYYANGDSLLRQLMGKVLDTEQPETAFKKYHNTINQIIEDEYFINNDSIAWALDTAGLGGGYYSYESERKSKKKFRKLVYYLDTRKEAEGIDLALIDTSLQSDIYGKLKYSFDEFVPKVNYNNYYTFDENVKTSILGFKDYKSLIDTSDQFIRTVLFEDFSRQQKAKKWAIAKYNFISALKPEEKEAYYKILRKVRDLFPDRILGLSEYGLFNTISPEMLGEDKKSKDSKDNQQTDLSSNYDYNLKKMNIDSSGLQAIEKINTVFSSLKNTGDSLYIVDSVNISQRLRDFRKGLSAESKFWYNSFIKETGDNFKTIYKSINNNYEWRWRYLPSSIDTLLHKVGKEKVDLIHDSLTNYDIIFLRESHYYKPFNNIDSLIEKYVFNGSGINLYKLNIFDKKHPAYNDDCSDLIQYIKELIKHKLNCKTSGLDLQDYWKFQQLLNRSTFYGARSYYYYSRDDYKLDSVVIDNKVLRNEIDAAVILIKSKLASLNLEKYNFQTVNFKNSYNLSCLCEYYSTSNSIFNQEFQYLIDYVNKPEEDGHYGPSYTSIYPLFMKDGALLDNFMSDYNRYSLYSEYANFQHIIPLKYWLSIVYQKYKSNNPWYSAGSLGFFRMNGFDVPAGATDDITAKRYLTYYGYEMPNGMREVVRARKNVQHFITSGLFQRHILSLLIFINALLFFTVSFETRVITSAFALAFLMLILLNFFLGKFFDANQGYVDTSVFPSDKQKIIFAVLLIPLCISVLSLFIFRRKISLPGFLMNMVVVFALSLLTTNPNLYYGNNLQTVENPRSLNTSVTAKKDLTQYDLFYYLTLYLGLTVTFGSILLRRNQILPEKR